MKYNALKKINEEDTMGTNIKPVVKKSMIIYGG